MIRTATAAVNAKVARSPVPSQKPRVATARAITMGTNTPDTRSARRWTGALPVWASVTSRAICTSAVSAPTLVTRTTSRPPAFTVAPATSDPGLTSTGTDSPVSMLMSTAEAPSSTTLSVAIFSRANHEAVAGLELLYRQRGARCRSRHERHVLGAELQQCPERGAGAALCAGLGIPAGQDEGRDHGRGLEIRVGVASDDRVDRPQPRREHANADERVHGRRAVLQVRPGRSVEWPGAPEHQPLPGVELERGDQRQEQDGQRQRRRDGDPAPD